MSADTEEVTPPTDVTLGEEPQSEVQSLITLWSNKSMDPTRPFRRRRPRSAGDMRAVSMMTPPSFKRQPIRCSSSSDIGFRSVESTECYSLSMMRSIRSMEPPTSSSFDFHRSNDSMESPLSSSKQQNPGSSSSLNTSLNVDSPESLCLQRSSNLPWFRQSKRSSRSMEPPNSFRVLQGPDSLDPGPEPVSLPEPGFTADISVKRLPMGYIEPPPSVSGQQNPEEFLIYMAKLIFIM